MREGWGSVEKASGLCGRICVCVRGVSSLTAINQHSHYPKLCVSLSLSTLLHAPRHQPDGKKKWISDGDGADVVSPEPWQADVNNLY